MAKVHCRYEHFDFGDWEFRQYPMMAYPGSKDGGKTPDRNPKYNPGDPKSPPFLQEPVIVNSDEELEAVLNGGEDAPELISSNGLNTGTKRVKTAEDEKSELLAEAETLGVAVDKRWGADKIKAAIEAFKAEDVPV